ncbi:hypothetical protein FHT77_006107 [Rhizobium sp. BK181]|nr:hypothetical protein [Rhizobium sp. BK181]
MTVVAWKNAPAWRTAASVSSIAERPTATIESPAAAKAIAIAWPRPEALRYLIDYEGLDKTVLPYFGKLPDRACWRAG